MNKIEIINSEEELKSFPINQSIFLKSINKIEDSFIKTNIVLIRTLKEHGLLNSSDLYNQNIGYIKNEFDVVPMDISEEKLEDYWKITCNPVNPLTPGASYILFIDKNLSEEYAEITKVPEKSKGPSTLLLKNINLVGAKEEVIYKFKVLSEPLITSTNNIVKFQIYYNNTPLKTVIINAKSENKFITFNGIEVEVRDVPYGLGEEFDLVIKPPKTVLDRNYVVEITTAASSSVTPLENVKPSTAISNEMVLNYYKDLNQKTEDKGINFNNPNWVDSEYVIEYLGDSDFILKLNRLSVEDLDLNDLTVREFAAFNRYDLTAINKYNKNVTFNLSFEVLDDKSILFSLEESK